MGKDIPNLLKEEYHDAARCFESYEAGGRVFQVKTSGREILVRGSCSGAPKIIIDSIFLSRPPFLSQVERQP